MFSFQLGGFLGVRLLRLMMISFIGNCQSAFQSGYTIRYSHKPYMKFQLLCILSSTWHCLFLIFLVVMNLIDL